MTVMSFRKRYTAVFLFITIDSKPAYQEYLKRGLEEISGWNREKHDWEKAKAYWLMVLDSDPENEVSGVNMAAYYYQKGYFMKAFESLFAFPCPSLRRACHRDSTASWRRGSIR